MLEKQIKELRSEITDFGSNQWKNTKDITKLKNIMFNIEKRLIWCEENLKVKKG